MRISQIKIHEFKRFTDLTIEKIPETAKLVVLVGPNGCGKTSLFEAFNHWYKLKSFGNFGDQSYFLKKDCSNIRKDGWFNRVVDIQFYSTMPCNQEDFRGKFYFRSAYRNEPTFVVNNLNRQENPTQNALDNLMRTESNVSSNYQRLVSQTLAGVFDTQNDEKRVSTLREELVGKIRNSLNRVFEDLTLSSIGNPLQNGSFYFTKGSSNNFAYMNLSAGEKSAFDLILDIIVKSGYYKDSVFCIDEPEAHMHAALQERLLDELYNLIPEESQLWVSTHSMGMLKKAKELEEQNPGTVIFLDFENRDFDSSVVMSPSKIDSTMWNRFMKLAFGELSSLIAPQTIVFCEGNSQGRKYKDFDAQIYKKMFERERPDVFFSSVGSCSEIENENNISFNIISKLLQNSTMIKVVDRDGKSDEEIEECNAKGIKVLSKRHIECYLLDDEILQKLCESVGKLDKCNDVLLAKQSALAASISRGNASDDLKSASGDIYVQLKKILDITRGGNTKDAFFRDTLVPLITPETAVYQGLKQEIFG